MNPRTLFSYNKTSLFSFIADNNVEALKKILSENNAIDKLLNERYSKNEVVVDESLFHAAARLGRDKCLEILLSYAGNTDLDKLLAAYYASGSNPPIVLTPMQTAIREGNKACEILLENHQNDLHKNNTTLPNLQRIPCGGSSENQ